MSYYFLLMLMHLGLSVEILQKAELLEGRAKATIYNCPTTWRTIPFSKWLITMVSFRPLSRVVPLPNGRFMAYKRGLLTTYDTWDDPPSGMAISGQVHMASGPNSATKRRISSI